MSKRPEQDDFNQPSAKRGPASSNETDELPAQVQVPEEAADPAPVPNISDFDVEIAMIDFADEVEVEDSDPTDVALALELSLGFNENTDGDSGDENTPPERPHYSSPNPDSAELRRCLSYDGTTSFLHQEENILNQPSTSRAMATVPDIHESAEAEDGNGSDGNLSWKSQVHEAIEGQSCGSHLSVQFSGMRTDKQLIKNIKQILESPFSTFDLTLNLKRMEQFRIILNQIQDYDLVLQVKSLILKFVESGQVLEEKDFCLINQVFDLTVLEIAELNCGLSNVESATINDFFYSCKGCLKTFKIRNNFKGNILDEKVLELVLPEMKKLESFSFCEHYNFLEVNETPVAAYVRQPATSVSEQLKPFNVLVSLRGQFVSLRKLAVGFMISINVIDLKPEDFPKLEVFKVRSPWHNFIDVSEFPVWTTITELALPDYVDNSDFVVNIKRLFPELLTVRISFPTPMCLRRFINNMCFSNLEHIFLRFQYDFPLVLESALQAKSFDAYPSLKEFLTTGYNELEMLKNPEDGNKVYNSFVRHHAISLPLTASEMDENPCGMQWITFLKTINIKHVPRQIKIPISNTLDFKSMKAHFNAHKMIGLQKYPVHASFFDETVSTIEKFKFENLFIISPDDAFHWQCPRFGLRLNIGSNKPYPGDDDDSESNDVLPTSAAS